MNSNNDDAGPAGANQPAARKQLRQLRLALATARGEQAAAAARLSLALARMKRAAGKLDKATAAWRRRNREVVRLQEQIERILAGR